VSLLSEAVGARQLLETREEHLSSRLLILTQAESACMGRRFFTAFHIFNELPCKGYGLSLFSAKASTERGICSH
jgi:hypothetical protein